MDDSERTPINLVELERLAQQRLPKMAFDYYVSGANDEITVSENQAAFSRLRLLPRMLVDVSHRELSLTLFGDHISMPIMIAPTAFQCMAHDDGEIATAKAAGQAGTVMILSTLATSSIEEVVACASGPVWFQLYVYRDRKVTEMLVKRAENAGCKAIVFTVDSPMLGRRERDVKNKFHLPPHLSVKNLVGAGLDVVPSDLTGSGLAAYIASLYDTALTWQHVDWLRSVTKLPILLKGIMRADDAILAVEHGVDGIIVSNHGGRQLDTVPATIDVLAAVVEAVKGRVPVLVDGGVRRGTDVLKALALGAQAVLIGRPILWGLALDGEKGVATVLELLKQELDLAMALAGCTSVRHVPADLIFN